MSFFRRLLPFSIAVLAVACLTWPSAAHARQVRVKVEWYDPNGRWDIPLVCFELMRRDPDLMCTEFTQMQFKGGMGYQSGRVMALSTGAGPDVFNMWTNEIASYKEQGFLLKLNKYIGQDGVRADGTKKLKPDGTPDTNGQIDDDEARWPYWKKLSRVTRKIATFDGDVHSIPARRTDYLGVMYRKDVLKEHGVPEEPPRNWDEFYLRLQKMTWPKMRIRGVEKQFGRRGWYQNAYYMYLYPWVWASGANFVMEGKTNPRTNRTHWYKKEELDFIDPETGESLAQYPSQWNVTIDSPEGQAAFAFLWKLRWGPWIRDAETGEPINLDQSDIEAGTVRRADGKLVRFSEEDIIRGVMRSPSGQDEVHKHRQFERGEIACFQAAVGTDDQTGSLEVRSEQLGFWALPPRVDSITPVLYESRHWLGLGPGLRDDPVKQSKAWDVASALGSELGKNMYTKYVVAQGNAMFLTPEKLRMAGLEAYIEEIPEHWLRDYKRVLGNRRYEPFNPNALQVIRNELSTGIFERILLEEDFDWREALTTAQKRANTYIMRGRPEEEMKRYRKWAYGILIVVAGLLVAGGVVIFRSIREKAAASMKRHGGQVSVRNVYRRWMPWLLLVPALLSIGIWAYFPLVRGTIMAFMDYRLMTESRWVGVDNWINIVLDPVFRDSLLATLRYVAIALGLTFAAPIVLAIMLNEIPWLKQSFRTVFFLPQVMSGIVTMLLWTEMFDRSEYGLLNQMVMFVANTVLRFDVEPINWLGSTFWAPLCVVVPLLWASVGMGSLIYLAALKSVPEDIYEAADIDGAGLFQKIRHITLPTLYPLIVINFVGAFIGCFHHMQNIFVMTGGQAGTRVLSLHIWLTAYADLKFGPATATAWILGAMLISFTVWQLRILKKVEFRRAAEN